MAGTLCLTGTGLAAADATLDPGHVSTFAGDGLYATVDGTGTSASLKSPAGVALVDGALYVSTNGSIRRVNVTNGLVQTVAGGSGAGCAQDSATPSSVTFGTAGPLASDGTFLYTVTSCTTGVWYVRATDPLTGATTRVGQFSSSGSVAPSAVAIIGSMLYIGVGADLVSFDTVTAASSVVATAASGFTFPAVTVDSTTVWAVTRNAVSGASQLVSINPLSGAVTGVGASTSFDLGGPGGTSIADAGTHVFVGFGNRIRRYAKADGAWTDVAGNGPYGQGFADGTATDAWLFGPAGMVFDGQGLWVSDQGRIRRVTQGTALPSAQSPLALATIGLSEKAVVTVTQTPGAATVDGPLATVASFNNGTGMVVVGNDKFIATNGPLRKVDASGNVSTFVPAAADCGGGGPTGATSSMSGGESLTTDGYYLYAGDRCGRVQRISLATGAVSTVVSTGSTTRAGKLAMGPDGFLYMAGLRINGGAQLDPTVYRINPRTGIKSVFAAYPASTMSMGAIAADADALWVVVRVPCAACPNAAKNSLDRIDLGTAAITTLIEDTADPNNQPAPWGTTLVSAGEYLYADRSNEIARYNKATGAADLHVAGFQNLNVLLAEAIDGYGASAQLSPIQSMASDGSNLWFVDNPGRLRVMVDAPPGANDGAQDAESTIGGGNPDANDCQCQKADPVNTATGEFWSSTTDMTLPGRLPVPWTRTYSSLKAAQNSPLGYGWTANQLELVAPASAGQPVKITTETGAVSTFHSRGSGVFVAEPRIHATLGKDAGTGEWVYKRRGILTARFNGAGKLVSRTDRHGHTVSLGYDANGRLTTVTAPDGRALTITYDANQRIWKVTGPSATGVAARQVVYTYSAAGNLTGVKDSRGKNWTYGYDTAHRMTSMTTPTGEVTTTSYDASGKVEWQRNPRSKTSTLSYTDSVNGDVKHRATRVTDPAGVITDYEYDNGWLTKRTLAPTGGTPSVWTYTYDAAGNQTSTLDPTGVGTVSTYDGAGNRLSLKQSAGLTAPDGSVPATSTTKWTYNKFNKPLTQVDGDGRSTTWTYDARGNVKTQVTQLSSGQNATTTWTRTDTANPDDVTTVTDPIGTVTGFAYTAEGFVAASTSTRGTVSGTTDTTATTKYTYTPYGEVRTVVEPRGNVTGGTASQYTTTNTYDNGGLLLTTKTPLGYTTTLGYDNDGRRTSVKNSALKTWTTAYVAGDLVDTVTDPLAHVTVDNAYDDADRLSSTTDATGRTTSYTYDDHGRMLTSMLPAGNAAGASAATKTASTTTYWYDLAGRQLASTTPDPAGGSPLSVSTVFDGAGRVWKSVDSGNNTTITAYDMLNRVTSITDPTFATTSFSYDWASRRTRIVDPTQQTTTLTYDKAGHLTSSLDPLGRLTSHTYNPAGLPATKVDPRGNASATPTNYTTSYLYDIAGNLTQTTDNRGNPWKTTYDRDTRIATQVNGKTRTTTYAYVATTGNAPSQLWKITAPDGGVTQYGYDAANRRTTVTAPMLGVWSTGYDDAGRITSETDPALVARTYGYTPNGQLQTIASPRGTVTRAYNPIGQLTGIDYSDTTPDIGMAYDRTGRRSSMTDAAGTVTYTYNANSRPLNIVRTPTTGPTTTWGYTYDTRGNVKTRTRPDLSTETWTYDNANQPTAVTSPEGSTGWTYDEDGNPLVTTMPNGTTETRTWDRNGALASLVTKAGSTTLTSQTVTRDNANQPSKTVVTRGAATETRGYLYDTNERLVDVCYTTATCTATNSTQHWTYDKNGNRLTERNGISPGVTTTSTYDSSDRLTGQQIGTGTITVPSYDADGNMITDGNGRTWTYGLDGLTRSITTPTNTTTYGYDGDGRRLTSNVTAGTGAGSNTAYTWDANAPLAMLVGISTDPDGAGPTAATASSIRYDAGGVGTALNQTSAGTTNWYAHDPLGSITDLTSSAGVITRSQDWTPYGTTRAPIGAPATPTGPLPILGWTGALPDTDTTWHLRARQYDPTVGTFITRDPAGMTGSAGYQGWYGTPYGYVTGRAAYAIDPSGRTPWEFLQGVGASAWDHSPVVQAQRFLADPAGYVELEKQRWEEMGAFDYINSSLNPMVEFYSSVDNFANACNDYQRGYATYSATHAATSTVAVAAGVGAGGGLAVARFRARAGGATEGAASAGDHIVLGLKNFGLEDTAAKVGGRTLLKDPDWQASVQKAIGDPSTKFTVSVDGMSGSSTYSQVIGAAQRGASGVGGYTDWEMAQLFGGGRLPDVTFVRGGTAIPNPFG
jgi:RHS repeat-associated protein